MKPKYKKAIKIVLSNFVIISLLFLFAEIIIRITHPEIKFPRIEKSLIKDSLYYSSPGLIPNAQGYSNDVFKIVNHLGFWRYSKKYNKNKPSWLICGDSITMVIGCENASTFISIMNNTIDSINILNSALIGYSSADYFNVTKKLLVDEKNSLHITKVMIFWCLNDIYSNFPDIETPGFHNDNLFGKVMIFFRTNSKLYQFLKKHIYR